MGFISVDEAIRVLRKGRKDDQWFEAASFLIDRASPEVTLMLEVGRELERKERADNGKQLSRHPYKVWGLVFLGALALAGSAGYIGWLITRSIGVTC
ncbi:hypothetical protein [Alkalimarinus coralli]|uniref:hypothetical protein n=1 Tax=Alkalimarinus coralli TaxID=2935863 RepID=UPI00202B9BDD|nr:hypothetical protein [Alkalimarinus coralli]